MEFKDYDDLVGKHLKQNITDVRGVLLIAKGTLLLPEHIDKLKKFNIHILDVESALEVNEVDEETNDKIHTHNQDNHDQPRIHFPSIPTKELIQQTESYLKGMKDSLELTGTVDIEEVEEKLTSVIMDTSNSASLFRLLSELKGTRDFRYTHNMGVAFIATKLGKQLRLDEQELKTLTTAATLYDIGSTKLPSDLVNKTSRFNANEYEIMKQHTIWGHDMLKNSMASPRVALVALEHHEREDGSGYPHRLKGDQIDPLSKIVALADIYMAMISPRPYREAHPFFNVVNMIHEEIMDNRLESQIGLTFLESLMASQLGCEVLLSDGRQGKIVLVDRNYPTRPLIALENQDFLDLTKTTTINVKEIIG